MLLMIKMMELLPCAQCPSRLVIRAYTSSVGSASTSMGIFRALVVFAVLAFAIELAEGQQCRSCLTYWECIVTGGTPITYCDQHSSDVCCLFGSDRETSAYQIAGTEPALTEPQNELEEEKPATETPPFRPKPRHPFILPTSVSPPPPVRFFGNRIIRPVINSAAGHFVPTKPLMTQDGNPSQNGSKLDAFPSSVTAQPVINRVPSKEAPSTPNQPASQTNSSTTNGGAIRGNQTTTVRIVPANDVAAIAKDHDVPSHLSRGSASTTERQLLERTIKLSHGRHFLKIVQAPGELLTRVSLQPFPLQQQDNETVTSAIQDNGVRQTHSSQPRKAFSFRPHRAPSSQQLSVQEEDTDHEEIAPSELPPAVHEAIRQGFPGREIKRVFKHSQNSRPVLVLGSRLIRDSNTTVEKLEEALESVIIPRFSFKDTKKRHH